MSIEYNIKNHAFFKGIDVDISSIANYSTLTIFKEGEIIFREGDKADSIYFITHGRVALELSTAHKGKIIIQTIGKDEVLGISWLFPPYKWHFDARAIELTRAIKVDANLMIKNCEEDNRLGYVIMKGLASIIMKRLQAVRIQLLEMEEM
ncbi:MAG: cyclic nucleotide-binding domain-containing protein [Candidatus Nitrosocaldaceae archaeon]